MMGSDLNKLFYILEFLHYGFETRQGGDGTYLVLVKLGFWSIVLLNTFLCKRMHDPSDERGWGTLAHIPLSFGQF